MDIKKKIWLSLVLIAVVPVLLAFWVIDDLINRDQSSTNWLIFDTSYTTSMVELREEIEAQFSRDGSVDLNILIKDVESDQAILNNRYAAAIVSKNNEMVYASELLTDEIATYIVSEVNTDNISLVMDRYVVLQVENVRFDDGISGSFYLVIDNVELQNESDIYWLWQISIFTVTFIMLALVCILWISNDLRGSVTLIKRITQKLKKGELDEPLQYNSNDEFWELAHETEQLRLSLKSSLTRQEELEEEKRKMIADISHDLRTPLTAIRGYSQAIKDQVAKSEDERDEYLDIIQSKVTTIEELIDDLKSLTDFDNNTIEYSFQKLPLGEFLMDCIDDLHYEVKKAGGQLELKKPSEQVEINADPAKLSRVFVNIIENAIKYRSQKPLEIDICVVNLNGSCNILVSDNGIGLSDEEMRFIFKRFYRADKSRNSDIGGSGLGLSICSDIIKAHGGDITAQRSDSGGLMIVIKLPCKETV